MIKLSILCLYIRLFGVRKSFTYACYVQMVLIVLWVVIGDFFFIFQCSPISVGWSPTQSGGSCFKSTNLVIGTNTANVVMDFAILLTPMYSIWTLKLPIRRKILVTGVLLLGGGYVCTLSQRLLYPSYRSSW